MKTCFCCKRRRMEVCNCARVHCRSCLLCHKNLPLHGEPAHACVCEADAAEEGGLTSAARL